MKRPARDENEVARSGNECLITVENLKLTSQNVVNFVFAGMYMWHRTRTGWH